MTHQQLFSLKPEEIDHEIQCSKERIEAKTGQAVTFFSYPYAFPDGRADFAHLISDLLKACGYKVGVTTRLGSTTKADAPFFLKRIPFNSQDDMAFFEAKLLDVYNWLYWFQVGHKKMKMGLKYTFSKQGLNLTRK